MKRIYSSSDKIDIKYNKFLYIGKVNFDDDYFKKLDNINCDMEVVVEDNSGKKILLKDIIRIALLFRKTLIISLLFSLK